MKEKFRKFLFLLYGESNDFFSGNSADVFPLSEITCLRSQPHAARRRVNFPDNGQCGLLAKLDKTAFEILTALFSEAPVFVLNLTGL